MHVSWIRESGWPDPPERGWPHLSICNVIEKQPRRIEKPPAERKNIVAEGTVEPYGRAERPPTILARGPGSGPQRQGGCAADTLPCPTSCTSCPPWGLLLLQGVRQSLEQKVGLSPSDSAFRDQTDKVLRSSEPVPSCVRNLPQMAHSYRSVIERVHYYSCPVSTGSRRTLKPALDAVAGPIGVLERG